MKKFYNLSRKEEAPEPVPSRDPELVAGMLCRFPDQICIHRYSQEAEILCLAENRKVRRAARCGKNREVA